MEIQVVWLSGIFDGEGTISIVKTHGVGFYELRVRVANTERELVQPFSDYFGGNVWFHQPRNLKWSPSWSWCVTATRAVNALLTMRPYLQSPKKLQAVSIAIEYQRGKRIEFGKSSRSQAYMEREQLYRAQMQALYPTRQRR